MMNLYTIKLDNIFVLDFLEELYLLGYCLQGTRVLFLNGNLEKWE